MARQFKHLNRKQEEQSTRQENKQDSTDKAAPKAVRESSAIRGERAGQEKLEALTVFSQKIQARKKRGNQKGSRREQSSRKLRSKGQYRGIRSQRTKDQGVICSMDETSL